MARPGRGAPGPVDPVVRVEVGAITVCVKPGTGEPVAVGAITVCVRPGIGEPVVVGAIKVFLGPNVGELIAVGFILCRRARIEGLPVVGPVWR